MMPLRKLFPSLMLILLATLPRPAGAQTPTVAILPVEGAPQHAAELDRSLGRAVAARGLRDALGPLELAARLRAEPTIKQALVQLADALSKARKAALFMRRRPAVSAARSAISAAQLAFTRYHQRQLLAESYEALAQALLLKPADESGAFEAFKLSVQADPAYAPPAGRMNPTTTRLLRQAQSSYVPTPPAPTRLDALAKLLGVRRVVWLAIGAQGSQGSLQLATHEVGGKGTHLRRALTSGKLTSEVAQQLVTLLSPAKPASAPTRVVVIEKQPTSLPTSQPTSRSLLPPPVAKAAGTPWYKKWWVWTLVGVAVAGGVTAAVLATREHHDNFDMKFEF